MTIPDRLYLNIRTGLHVERPAFEHWTPGDVAQWDSEHISFVRVVIAEETARGAVRHALEMLAEGLSKQPVAPECFGHGADFARDVFGMAAEMASDAASEVGK